MAMTLDYLLDRQISSQWRGVLVALAEEFDHVDIAVSASDELTSMG
jgi:hypothetical protein